MANIQKQFDQFNDTIKLKRFDENQTLRDKREILRKKLEERLPGVFTAHDEECLPFTFRDQGSYKMGTGVKPLKGDFDIDQGMYFVTSTEEFPDPVKLKQRVHEALEGHTKSVRIRSSCVTVFYETGGEPQYHVDVAVYADGSQEPDGKPRLAKGKENSVAENRTWEISKPQKLADVVLDGFSDEDDRKQFRRLVRYLKRWRDERFIEGGNAAPIGLALTVHVLNHMTPGYAFDGKPDDVRALQGVVNAALLQFRPRWDNDESTFVERLEVQLPVEPGSDLLAKMSNRQMAEFREELKGLRDSLLYASNEVDPVDACKELHRRFGRDFPIPEPEATAKKHGPAIVSSSSSAA